MTYYEVFDDDSGNILRQLRTLGEAQAYIQRALNPSEAEGLRLFEVDEGRLRLIASDSGLFDRILTRPLFYAEMPTLSTVTAAALSTIRRIEVRIAAPGVLARSQTTKAGSAFDLIHPIEIRFA